MDIEEVQRMYGDLLEEQHLANKPLYDYRGKEFIPLADNARIQAIVNIYSKITAETMLNLSNTNAMGFVDINGNFSTIEKAYTKVLDEAVMQVTSGATDFHSAMRGAVKQLGGSGVRVAYESGISRGLDSVVRQSVLWGAKQASVKYNEMIGEELGCDGCEIDAHSSPRPSHMFMQGQQYAIGGARTVNGVRYEGFAESGAESALQDYGCLHFKTPIILGISEPTYSKEQLAQIEADNKKIYTIDDIEGNNYDWSQRMRNLESAVRREKRELEIFKASGDNAGASQCRERIKAYQSKYKEISEVTGIAEDRKRMAYRGNAELTKTKNGGIIGVGNEVFRKKSNKNMSNRIAISQKRFDELTIQARKNGAKIIKSEYGDEIFNHLEKSGATASCIGDTLLFRPDATASEVLEETQHYMQNINRVNDDKPYVLRTILNEIEVKEFIINNAKKYKVPRVEIEETINHLENYKKQLKEYYKGE